MKKSLKLLSILLMVVMISTMFVMPVFAEGEDAEQEEEAVVGITLTPDKITPANSEGTEKLQDLGGKIYGAIFTAGIVISVIVMAVLGIRYMLGSTEDKSEYKKSMLPYIVGALCVFGASTIATIVFNLTKV